MKKNIINTCIAATLLGLSTVSAQAASISLSPTNTTIIIGETVTFDMFADAADVGGILAVSLDLFYNNTVLTYNGDFTFDPSFPTDPSLSRPGTGDPGDGAATPSAAGCSVPGKINGIAFGSFTGGLAASGPTLVGSLSFTGLNLGTSLLTMTDNDIPAGAWLANDGSGPLVIDYIGATVNAVPVPAAA